MLIANGQVWEKPIKRKQSSSGSHGVEIRLPLFGVSDGATARRAAIEALLLSPYLALDRPYYVGLEFMPSGEVGVRVRAAVFDASQKDLFESSIIENYQLLMRDFVPIRDRAPLHPRARLTQGLFVDDGFFCRN